MVDHARYHLSQKRDQRLQVTLDDAAVAPQDARLVDLLGLDTALAKLHTEAADLAELVELHFFGGMKFAEIAQSRGVSLSTIEREWRMARAALYAHIQ
jgi:DNA-directed RNA polymerase specialized sigma24 family protein